MSLAERAERDMSTSVATPIVEELRERIQRLEGAATRRRAVLTFGVKEVDRRLPEGGLALGALHEVAGGGNGAVDGAAAALFAAGIAARTRGQVLWCVTRKDLFAPALAQAGLAPDRVIYVEASDEKSVLACFEEGLRHGGARRGRRRSRSALDDGLPPASACGGRLRLDRHRHTALAASDRGCGLRSADGLCHALARQRAPLDALACSRRRTREVAGRVDPLSRRRKRRFRVGGV